jgi:PAS domain S-box-containing protein
VNFRTFCERSTDGIWIINGEGLTVYVNPALATMFRTSVDAMVGRPFFDFMDRDEHALAEHFLQRWTAGIAEAHEFHFVRCDGTPLVALLNCSSLGVEGAGCYIAQLIEVEAIHQQRRDVAIIESNFKRLITFSPYAIALTTSTGQITMVNRAFESVFGLTADTAQRVNIDALVEWPDSEPQWSSTAGGQATGNYIVRLHKAGRQVPRELRVVVLPLVDAAGLTGAMHCYVDITDGLVTQRTLLAERDELEQRFRERAEANRLQALAMDATLEGMAILRGGTYVYMNPAHARMYGWEADDLVGLTWRELYTPAVQRWIESVAFPNLQADGRWQGEVVGLKRNGDAAQIEISLTSAGDDILVCCCRDISNRRAQEQHLRDTVKALDKANETLRAADRVKDLFLACMSHELRTPLHSILGCAELLGEEHFGTLTSTQRRYLTQLEESGRHLLFLINDILDVSKIAAGALTLDFAPVPVAEALTAAAAVVAQAAQAKGLRVSVPPAPAPALLVWADERRLRQILSNLLSNAVKFTNAGGRIDITATATPTTVRISVTDTGIGIPEDAQLALFQPFHQIDGSLTRRYEGSGLGLYLAKRLAEQHNGDIVVESRVGEGSCFTLVLPRFERALPPPMESPEVSE